MAHPDSAQVLVANVHPSLEVDQHQVRRAALEILRKEGASGARVNVVLASDAVLGDLNSRYLGREGPTDVLAFPMGGDEYATQSASITGEVYVSLDRAEQQALEFKVSFAQEVARLVIHGMLHLCGYDHQDAQEARLMRAREENFLESAR